MKNDAQRRTRGARRIQRISAGSAVSALIVAGAATAVLAQQQALTPPQDPAAVERGRSLLSQECGFCHGANARGGSSGPDLTRSALVQEDENGKQLGEFLRVGRPDRGMPKFDLPDARVADVAAFLHAEIYLASNRRLYKILDVLVGDPKAGKTYFNAPGRAATCHPATGNLKGVGPKTDPGARQERRGNPPPAGVPGPPAHEDPNPG